MIWKINYLKRSQSIWLTWICLNIFLIHIFINLIYNDHYLEKYYFLFSKLIEFYLKLFFNFFKANFFILFQKNFKGIGFRWVVSGDIHDRKPDGDLSLLTNNDLSLFSLFFYPQLLLDPLIFYNHCFKYPGMWSENNLKYRSLVLK